MGVLPEYQQSASLSTTESQSALAGCWTRCCTTASGTAVACFRTHIACCAASSPFKGRGQYWQHVTFRDASIGPCICRDMVEAGRMC